MPPPLQTTPAAAFDWNTLAAREHLVQIYADETDFLDALEPYVSAGIDNGEVIVLIATQEHLDALEERLASGGFDLHGARAHQLYITFDASDTLQKFMVRDWPDEALFQHFVHRVIQRADGRRIRAFGEMVALLLARGQTEAMLRLEHLWHRALASNDMLLFCAYPRAAFVPHMGSTIQEVCAAHSCVVG
jgi:hypothetical protein